MSEALKIMSEMDGFEVTNVSVDNTEPTYHRVNHRYKDIMIVPMIAVSSNLSFCTSKGDRYILTADNVRCKVEEWSEKHICDLEKDIQDMYRINAWDFIKRWHSIYPQMTSMHFFVIKVSKMEESKDE